MLLLKHGQTALVALVSRLVRTLVGSARALLRLLHYNQCLLLALPVGLVRGVLSLLKRVIQLKAVQRLQAGARQLLTVQVAASINDQLEGSDSGVRTSTRVSSYTALLFGMFR